MDTNATSSVDWLTGMVMVEPDQLLFSVGRQYTVDGRGVLPLADVGRKERTPVPPYASVHIRVRHVGDSRFAALFWVRRGLNSANERRGQLLLMRRD